MVRRRLRYSIVSLSGLGDACASRSRRCLSRKRRRRAASAQAAAGNRRPQASFVRECLTGRAPDDASDWRNRRQARTVMAMCQLGSNDLVISGPCSILERLRASLAGEGSVIEFARVLPPPAELEGARRRRWCTEHWGTAASPGASAQLIDNAPENGLLSYSFRTTSAPIALIAYFAAQHPLVDITLIHECDRRHSGRRYKWSGGRQTSFVDLDAELLRTSRCGEQRCVARLVLDARDRRRGQLRTRCRTKAERCASGERRSPGRPCAPRDAERSVTRRQRRPGARTTRARRP